VAGEEGFGVAQAPGGDADVASPPQQERPPAETAGPVADLVADHGAEDPEYQGVAETQYPPMGERPGGEPDGFAGQRHPGALQHHPEEDHQVAIPADQLQQAAQRRHAAVRAFIARPTSTARITSESSACTIISTFTRRLRNAASVGLKAVLVLKARKE